MIFLKPHTLRFSTEKKIHTYHFLAENMTVGAHSGIVDLRLDPSFTPFGHPQRAPRARGLRHLWRRWENQG